MFKFKIYLNITCIIFKWIDTNVYDWMKYIYKPKCSKTLSFEDNNLAIFMRKLKHLLYESYTRSRIDQLFNIIIGKCICVHNHSL